MVKMIPTRQEIDPALTWDLTPVFPDEEAWEVACQHILDQLPAIETVRGTLGQSPATLAGALQLRDSIGQLLERISAYAHLQADLDTRNAHAQGIFDRARALGAKYAVAVSFITPEIIAIPAETLADWIDHAPELALYHHELQDIIRERPHVRTAEVEALLAGASDFMQGNIRTFNMLTDADMRFGAIEDETGQPVQLSFGNYGMFLQSTEPRVRREAFQMMHETFGRWQHTTAQLYSTQIRQRIVVTRQQRYPSTIEAALSARNIPLAVYTNLVETVEQNLAPLHRYLRLRRRVLGVDDLHIYDMSAPLVPDMTIPVAFDEARAMVLQAMAPLGEDYLRVLGHGLSSRWIDVMETAGKRSGAYSMGVYGVHPFVLLNYQGRLADVFTVAHELGHALHSHYSFATQPYPYAHYTIFIAEIASTFNEALLTDHLLKTRHDRAEKAYLLTQHLGRMYSTLYRQTMFAHFEQMAHASAERGEALTAERLAEMYVTLCQRYFAPANVVVDEAVQWEWSRIPHFYRPFYVYQYATGIAASTALAKQVLTEGSPAIERYLTLLRSGSSDYTIELLKRAGVDMTMPAPVAAALEEFDRLVGELETLLG